MTRQFVRHFLKISTIISCIPSHSCFKALLVFFLLTIGFIFDLLNVSKYWIYIQSVFIVDNKHHKGNRVTFVTSNPRVKYVNVLTIYFYFLNRIHRKNMLKINCTSKHSRYMYDMAWKCTSNTKLERNSPKIIENKNDTT